MNLRAYLEAKGYEFKESAGQDLAQTCPFCEDDKWHFYIDPEKALYFCHKCNAKGNEITLRKRFNDMENPNLTSFKKAIGAKEAKRPPDDKADQYHKALFDNQAAFDYLLKRGLTLATIQHFRIGYMQDKKGGWLSIPYYENGELINFKFRLLPPGKKDFKRVFEAKSALFNQDCLKDHKEIVITEGELDAIMCWQAGIINVICGSNGCNSFDPEWIDQLEGIEKIYLWYDNDEPGRKALDDLVPRLGMERCWIIREEGYKDANEWFICNDAYDLTRAKQTPISNVIHFYDSVFKLFEHEKDLNSEIQTPWKNVNKLLGAIEAGDLITLSAVPKTGKCHGKGTKILMYDGSIKNVERIKKGDLLMGDDSTPREVLSLARGIDELFEIKQNKRDSYTINKDHVLSLCRRRYGKDRKFDIGFYDYRLLGDATKEKLKGYAVAIDFPQAKIELDPYFLGLWLGDGTSNAVQIQTADIEIEDYLNEMAKSMGLYITKHDTPNNQSSRISIVANHCVGGNPQSNPILDKLRQYNLIKNKHIPHNFKCNERLVRLRVLAGLVDTDGYVDKSSLTITLKSKQLADDVVFLCRSLGFRATIKPITKTIKSIGFKGIYQKVIVSGNLEEIPTLLERKKYKPNGGIKRNPLTTGIKVKYKGRGDYYGFTLTGNGRYLLGDFTVTHNTTMALNLATFNAMRGLPVLVYCLEMRPERLAKKVIEAVGKINKENFTRELALKTAERLINMPLYFGYNYKNINAETVFQTIRAAYRRFGLKLIIFDNLHYLVRSLAHVSQEVGNVTRSFKLLAEELHVPLILIAQPRKVEDSDIMTMNDLKDSSSIGADSDQIIILWREKTKSNPKNQEAQESSFKPKTLVRVDASRYTAGGDTALYFKGEYSLFTEIEKGQAHGY